jgi:PIN domain nuclease of toxin-antitoxin system
VVAVLDASAVLALIQKEPGGAQVVGYLQGGCMSAANYAEVLFVLGRAGIEIGVAQGLIAALRIEVVPMTAEIAATAATLGATGSRYGLSLGDRACLATAADRNVPVVTADRVWAELNLGIDVIAVR